MYDLLKSKRLMPRERRTSGFPVSRDWEDIDCAAVMCKYNRWSKCLIPSLAEIGEGGKCKGFKLKEREIIKEGD